MRSSLRLVREHQVLQLALLLVVVQLVFRAWATYTAWFTFDDFNFISRMVNEGLSPVVAFREYNGHVMPAGMYLSWLAQVVAPYDFRVLASGLLVMQTVADLGLVVLLVRLFGPRAGILPPLALYLFCVISVPVSIWWAAGVNQLPLQIVLFWGLASHVSYLRTGDLRYLWQTLAWLLGGLLFYEKTILVIGVLGIVSLAYFTKGGPTERLRAIWATRRAGIIALTALGVVYLAVYATVGLDFDPAQVDATSVNLADVAQRMVVQAYVPAVVGGPLQWADFSRFSLPEPGSAVILVSLVAVALIVVEIHRRRSRSLRAWLVPLFFVACNIPLVLAARASFVGSLISLDYRYQGELAAATAIALALATMPLKGAVESVERRSSSELLDHPRRVLAAGALVATLSLVSSLQYVDHWNHTESAEPYFDRLVGALEQAPAPVPLVDAQAPGYVIFGYPDGLLSRLLVQYDDRTDFVEVATDELNVVSESGAVLPASVTPVRGGLPGPKPGCGYSVSRKDVVIPLDGALGFGGWWVRIGYLSTGNSPVQVTAGDQTWSTTVQGGLHALYFLGGPEFREVRISGLARGVTLCTDDVVVGRPVPTEGVTQ